MGNENLILKDKQFESEREIKRLMDLGQAKEVQTSQLISDTNEMGVEIEKFKYQFEESNLQVNNLKETLKAKENDIDKIRNELQKNEITLIHAKEENRKIQSASQFEKAEMRRNSEDITNRLKNELAASKQNEEESKIDLQRAIQNLKEQKAKIEEL